MPYSVRMTAPGTVIEIAFLSLQGFIVVFLFVHEWIPMGRLNNDAAKRTEDSFAHLAFTTLLAALPAGLGLIDCVRYFGRPYPDWLTVFLWIMYGLFLFGMLRAWWIPYLFVPDAKRAERYQAIFAKTHAFLPVRNGIVPDTLHVCLHGATILTMMLLLVRDR
jgi:hypothetical protein